MNIVACRVDERLVHGQIMTSWSKYLQLKRIIVVDDQVAKDDFMTTVLAMSAPAGIHIEILTVDSASTCLVSDTANDRAMLLFKRILAALELARRLKDTPQAMTELNIGNIGSIPGRDQITKNVFLSKDEKNNILDLQSLGVSVFLQMLYTDPRIAADDIINRIG